MVTIQVSTLGPATITQIRTTIERELRGDVVYRVQQVAPTQHLPAEASA